MAAAGWKFKRERKGGTEPGTKRNNVTIAPQHLDMSLPNKEI
jgi:hypothetical protein